MVHLKETWALLVLGGSFEILRKELNLYFQLIMGMLVTTTNNLVHSNKASLQPLNLATKI